MLKYTLISNTSPLIHLGEVRALHLLPKIFQEYDILIPEEVKGEILEKTPTGEQLKKLIDNKEVALIPNHYDMNREDVEKIEREIAMESNYLESANPHQHLGESCVIDLGFKRKADLLLIDEKVARRKARQKGLRSATHIDVILHAKKKGIITEKECVKILEQLGVNYKRVEYLLNKNEEI